MSQIVRGRVALQHGTQGAGLLRMLDVLIVGAGPAGLSAALVLGRCRRRVLVCDDARPRNAASRALHGFLSRDGIAPRELLRIAREDLARYETVEVRHAKVVDVQRHPSHFEVALANGQALSTRKLLLATGIVDVLPQVEGIEDLYGTSVFHCPYCDGWEQRDRPLAAYGRGKEGAEFALSLTTWSRDLVLLTGGAALAEAERERLARFGIALREERVLRLEGRAGQLERVVFEAGEPLARAALFFSLGVRQRSELPARLGCRVTEEDGARTGALEETPVPGLYVAGDATRDFHLAIVAASDGARAAFAINLALTTEATGAGDRGAPASRRRRPLA